MSRKLRKKMEGKKRFELPAGFLESHSKDEEEIIRNLVINQDVFESPSEEELNIITPFTMSSCSKLIPLFTEKTFLTVQLIIKFSRGIPGFSHLRVEDQALLIHVHHGAVIMLRAARRYNWENESIFFANNGPFTKENFCKISSGTFGNDLFNLCQTMLEMRVDRAEYALLTAIVMLSDSQHLLDKAKALQLKECYLNVLRFYTANRPEGHYYRLISVLPLLETLGDMYNLFLRLEVDVESLSPSHQEIARTASIRENYAGRRS